MLAPNLDEKRMPNHDEGAHDEAQEHGPPALWPHALLRVQWARMRPPLAAPLDPEPDAGGAEGPPATWPPALLCAQWAVWSTEEQAAALETWTPADLDALFDALLPEQRYAYFFAHPTAPDTWTLEATWLVFLPYWRDPRERLRISARYCAVTGQKSSYTFDKAMDETAAHYIVPPPAEDAPFALDTFLAHVESLRDPAARFAYVLQHDLQLYGLPNKEWALLMSKLDGGLKGADWRELQKLRKAHRKGLAQARKAAEARQNGQAPLALDVEIPLSEYTNVLAFVAEHRQLLRYCFPWKSWLVWTGTHWHRDDTGQVGQYAKDTVKRLARQLADLEDPDATALLAHVKQSLKKASLDALVRSAQDEPPFPVLPSAMDQHIWLLNCANGTLDLRTGVLEPHQQTDFLTKCLTIPYDRTATCPRWLAFLWRIMGGSQGADTPEMSAAALEQRHTADTKAQEMLDYLQRVMGYTLTGSNREQCLFFCEGPTKTGKSTFLATMRHLLGDYGQQADMETFMHKDRPEVRNDLADLAGARYVYALEGQEGRRLSHNVVKQLTGGTDGMKARFLFQEYFTFQPEFTVFLGTNYLPKVSGDDAALWERIKRIPFVVQIPEEERDKSLDEQLKAELPGILAWAVQGCADWLRRGTLAQPSVVTNSTAAYQHDMDTLGRFLQEKCLIDVNVRVKAGDLYDAYKAWCLDNGEQDMLSMTAVGKRLDARGFSKKLLTYMYRLGIGLKV